MIVGCGIVRYLIAQKRQLRKPNPFGQIHAIGVSKIDLAKLLSSGRFSWQRI